MKMAREPARAARTGPRRCSASGAALFAPRCSRRTRTTSWSSTRRSGSPRPARALARDRPHGSDIYSRLLFGARITIAIGVIAVGASLLIGVPIGLVAGYYHNWVSDLLMRVSDIFLAVPQVVLAIAIAQTLGPSLPNVILALSVTYWPWFAAWCTRRRAAREGGVRRVDPALGASPIRLVALHVLPNIASPIIVRASIGMGFTILTAAALGFLGLGRPADAGVGAHHRRGAGVPARRLVVRDGARAGHLPDRDGLQSAGRRSSRRSRPADPARGERR